MLSAIFLGVTIRKNIPVTVCSVLYWPVVKELGLIYYCSLPAEGAAKHKD
jgi:hypothetical protein